MSGALRWISICDVSFLDIRVPMIICDLCVEAVIGTASLGRRVAGHEDVLCGYWFGDTLIDPSGWKVPVRVANIPNTCNG